MAESRTYVEAPAKPEGFDERVTDLCGRTLTGEPKVRVVWGWDAKCFRNGNPEALKYPNPVFLNRWIVEQWVPASFYGLPEDWEKLRWGVTAEGKKLDLLGEYPSRGTYIMVMPLLGAQGEYVPCSEDVITFINIMRKEFESRIGGAYSGAELHLQMEQRMARDQAELNAEADQQIDEYREWWRKNEDKINKDKVYSKNLQSSVLWTPNSSESAVH